MGQALGSVPFDICRSTRPWSYSLGTADGCLQSFEPTAGEPPFHRAWVWRLG